MISCAGLQPWKNRRWHRISFCSPPVPLDLARAPRSCFSAAYWGIGRRGRPSSVLHPGSCSWRVLSLVGLGEGPSQAVRRSGQNHTEGVPRTARTTLMNTVSRLPRSAPSPDPESGGTVCVCVYVCVCVSGEVGDEGGVEGHSRCTECLPCTRTSGTR